jgi:hypothetical protein
MVSKPREYCCCAIPLVNVGIYFALFFQTVIGAAVGLVSITTPSIVGARTPGIASWILAIICFVGAAIQLLGIMGVKQEKPDLYRRYVSLHGFINVAALSVAMAWIIMSAIGHDAAAAACDAEFFASGTSSTSQEGQILCDAFPWADVGIMGALWIIFAIAQLYFYLTVSVYGTMQRKDHKRFDSMYDPAEPLTSGIAAKENESWDQRGSVDRQETVDSVMNIPTGSRSEYPGADAYPPQRQPSRGNTIPNQPNQAYTQQEAPTPRYNDPYYAGYPTADSTGLNRPPASQAHPGE